MWLIMGIILLYTISSLDTNQVCTGDKCENSCEPLQWSVFSECETVNLSNKNITTIQTNSSSKLQKLDLSHNRLQGLPETFLSDATMLTEINLQNNNLTNLPNNFLRNSSKLQVLKLEGNWLTEIPSTVFLSGRLNLSIDCTCNLSSSIMQHLNNSTDQSKPSVTCASSSFESRLETLDDFFRKNCGSQMFLVLYIVLPIVALGLILGGVSLYLCKKKKNSADFESKTATEKSPSHGQPRYMTRNTDVTTSTLNQGPRQDYENVFVCQFQANSHEYLKEEHTPGAPSKQSMEEGIYLESDVNDGNQPIYSNTQGVYYNYHSDISMSKEEDDDVYILPDH